MIKHYTLREHEVVECSMMESAAMFADSAGRTVRKTTWPGKADEKGCEISTVFLGIDHNFGGREGDPPIVFETLVFGGPLDDWMRRYATWAEAEAGHEETVDLVRQAYRGKKPDSTVEMKFIRRPWHDRVLNDDTFDD